MIVTALRKTRIDVGQTEEDLRLWKTHVGHYARPPSLVASLGMLHKMHANCAEAAATAATFLR
jgi:hypothetical protein